MSAPSGEALEGDLRQLLDGPAPAGLAGRLRGHGLEVLPVLEPHLVRDLPIDVLERFEEVLKGVLAGALRPGLPAEDARRVAAFQQRLGLLPKYKSYAVKASHPLGYSIFLQNPGEGFSFQRHLTHKVEVFHILDVHPGGFVFLSSFEEWRRVYHPERFAAWLAGAADPDYERFRIPARPGDVFVIGELGIVHTAVGCILEEFATISTDRVDRLHDQNVGRPVPPWFGRPFVAEQLARVRAPAASRRFAGITAGAPAVELPARPVRGGFRTELFEGFVGATLLRVEAGGETDLAVDERRGTSLYVRGGAGRILLGSRAELARATPPSLQLAARDVLTLAPGLAYVLVNEGPEPLDLVLHQIEPDVALV